MSAVYKNVPLPRFRLPKLGHVIHFIKNGGCVSRTLRDLQGQYGDTFQVDVPAGTFVATKDPKLMRRVYVAKVRSTSWGMGLAAKMNSWPDDITNSRGSRTKAYRKVLNSVMMSRARAPYADVIDQKSVLFMEAMKHELGSEGKLKTGMYELTTLLSFECVLRIFIGVDEPILPVGYERPSTGKITMEEAIQLTKNISSMTEKIHELEHAPLGKFFGTNGRQYKEYVHSWEEIVKYTDRLTDPYINEYLETKTVTGSLLNASVLPKLLQQMDAENIEERLTADEVRWVLRFAYAASTDTVAQTLEYLLYHIALSSNELKETLRSEIANNPPGKSQFVQACIKESMRLIQTVPVNTRQLENDLEFVDSKGNEMKFPTGTRFLLDNGGVSGSDDNFENAKDFDPARYLRNSKDNRKASSDEDAVAASAAAAGCPYFAKKEEEQFETFAAGIGFGHGSRRCPGAAFALNVITAAFEKIAAEYEIGYNGPPLELWNRVIYRTKESISPHLTFTPIKA